MRIPMQSAKCRMGFPAFACSVLCIAHAAVNSTWTSSRCCGTIDCGIFATGGEYRLSSWNALIILVPLSIFVKNDALEITVAGGAAAFSLYSLSETAFKTSLFLSTIQFLCDDLDGRSSRQISSPVKNACVFSLQNFRSTANRLGAASRHVHVDSNMFFIFSAKRDVAIWRSLYVLLASTMFRT